MDAPEPREPPTSQERIQLKKRVLTPARREQNRAAQKIYRQRQKAERERQQALSSRGRERPLKPPPLKPRRDTPAIGHVSLSPSPGLTAVTPETDPDCLDELVVELVGSALPDDFALILDNPVVQVGGEGTLCEVDDTALQDQWAQLESLPSQNEVPYKAVPPPIAHDTPIFSDPYANTLQVVRTATVGACLANARAMSLCVRFDLSEILKRDYMSPLFDPRALPAIGPAVSSLLNQQPLGNSATPAHLRPTLPQILFPHLAAIDLLPLPQLRANAILLSVSTDGAFDLMELKKDVFQNVGIVCRWGQPWDARSWEPAPWFLRKWKLAFEWRRGTATEK